MWDTGNKNELGEGDNCGLTTRIRLGEVGIDPIGEVIG